jgi:hypothetical protein
MGTGRASPDPRFRSAIELAGGKCRGGINLAMIGEALARERIPAKQPPPPLDEVQPAGAGGNRLLMDAGMRGQPFPNWATGVAGEVVVDEVELALRVRGVDGLKKLEEACGIAGRCGEGERLPIIGTQGAVDPHLVGTTAVIQGSLNPMPIRRPAGSRRKGAGTHRSELIETEDRRPLRRLRGEADDPGSFGTQSGSVLSAQLRGCRHRIPSLSRMRRIWLRST